MVIPGPPVACREAPREPSLGVLGASGYVGWVGAEGRRSGRCSSCLAPATAYLLVWGLVFSHLLGGLEGEGRGLPGALPLPRTLPVGQLFVQLKGVAEA